MGEGVDLRGYCRKIPTALPFPVQPSEGPRLFPGPGRWGGGGVGEGALHYQRGAEGRPVSPNAGKRRGERGCMGMGASDPQFSSGTPGKHGRRKQDFQTPVQNRSPAPCPWNPTAHAAAKPLTGDGRAPLQGPETRGGTQRARSSSRAGSLGRLTAAAAKEEAAALARSPGGAAGLQRCRGCGGRDCGGRHLGALPAPALRTTRVLA